MSYQIALTQVVFNNNYENVMRFETRQEQETFFEVDRLFLNAPTLNLLKGDFFNLELPYKVQGVTLKQMESYNYCIIKEVVDNNTRYYYYFITNLRYDSSNQFILSLEMDIFNTYYIDASFSPSLINRAHLNRFDLVLDDQDNPVGVKFDNKPNSLMLIPDMPTELNKYCFARKPLYKTCFGNAAVDNWINENVECWLYVFLQRTPDPNHEGVYTKYKFYEGQGVARDIELPQALFSDEETFDTGAYHTQDFDNYYTFICMPIYKTNKRIKCLYAGYEFTFSTDAEGKFREINGDTSYYLARCISQMPPKNILSVTSGTYSIIDGNLILDYDVTGLQPVTGFGAPFMGGHLVTPNTAGKAKLAVFTPLWIQNREGTIVEQFPIPTTYSCKIRDLPTIYQNQFSFDLFNNADFNRAFNPKLYSSVYRSMKLANNDGSRFEYDMQKMNNNVVEFLYTEKPQPSVTRTYTRLNTYTNDYGVYMRPTSENLTGLVVSQDCNLSYSKDQLASYLAQNRNAQTQITARGIQGLTKALISGAGNTAFGAAIAGPAGAAAGAANTVSGMVNAGLDWGFSQLNFNLTKDNMAYAPDEVKNANGDVIFNMCCTEFNMFVEFYTAIDAEVDREAERMNLFGFKYNRLDNIKNVDNIRKYFNFVQGVVETATYYDELGVVRPVPPKVLYKFRDAFAKGVRFWNYSGGKFLDYSKENYENWLKPYVEGV